MTHPITPLFSLLVSACLFLAGASGPIEAQVTYVSGDLVLGFQATGGDGSSNTYEYNLGSGVGFRDGTTSGLIATIGTDLTNTFGVGWFNRSDVYWGIAGVRDPSAGGPVGVVLGDPKATIYVSRIAVGGPGTSSPWILASGPTVISAATSVSSMQFGFTTTNGSDVITPENQRTPTPSSNGRGVVQGTGEINNWSVFNPVGGSAFGNVLTGGVQAPLGVVGTQAWLDLYRIMGRSSAAATPNTPLGEGLLVGSFSINTAGDVQFQASAPPSDAYGTWASSFGLSGTAAAFDSDIDFDGLDNGVEFVVGGTPNLSTDGDNAPTITRDAEVVVFTFRQTDEAAVLNPTVQFSTDQFATWATASQGVGGVTIATDPDGFGTGVDRITVRIPWSPAVSASIFTRLRVVSMP